MPGSAAAQAGQLRRFDRLLAVNDSLLVYADKQTASNVCFAVVVAPFKMVQFFFFFFFVSALSLAEILQHLLLLAETSYLRLKTRLDASVGLCVYKFCSQFVCFICMRVCAVEFFCVLCTFFVVSCLAFLLF